MEKQFFTVKQYADRMCLSEDVVRRQIRKGNIKAKRIGKEYRIPVDEGEV